MTNPAIIAELEGIAKRHNGCLKAEDVVQAASSPKSAMHSWFEWDDSEAAQSWRLHQARMLIRVAVIVAPQSSTPSRVFVSLTPDRASGSGYRLIQAVLSKDEYRRQLLADALAEMERFQAKYAALQELAGVFRSMNRSVNKLKEAA